MDLLLRLWLLGSIWMQANLPLGHEGAPEKHGGIAHYPCLTLCLPALILTLPLKQCSKVSHPSCRTFISMRIVVIWRKKIGIGPTMHQMQITTSLTPIMQIRPDSTGHRGHLEWKHFNGRGESSKRGELKGFTSHQNRKKMGLKHSS